MKIDYITLEETDTFSTLFNKVKDVHTKLFPDATLQSQCNKFDEEYEEYKNAKDGEDICQEFADMFIVAAGIARFTKHLGEFLCYLMTNDLGDNTVLRVSLANAIVTKVNKNIDRKWDNNDGYYKHVTVN